jgi:hypothetical protein
MVVLGKPKQEKTVAQQLAVACDGQMIFGGVWRVWGCDSWLLLALTERQCFETSEGGRKPGFERDAQNETGTGSSTAQHSTAGKLTTRPRRLLAVTSLFSTRVLCPTARDLLVPTLLLPTSPATCMCLWWGQQPPQATHVCLPQGTTPTCASK